MNPCVTARRNTLLAGTIAGLLLAAPAFAQQPPASAPPAAAPARASARRPAPRLASAAPKVTRLPPSSRRLLLRRFPTAADKLPTAKLKLPKGFNIEVYASGMANARTLAGRRQRDRVRWQPPCRQGSLHHRKGRQDAKPRSLLSGLYRPNGLAYHNGTLYIAELPQSLQDRRC